MVSGVNTLKVDLIDKMGSDLTVVNAARVSFAKKSDWDHSIPFAEGNELKDSDAKLIKYLARHNHWSPFAHASLQFHIKAPIFVARQLVKHQVGLVWNEISRRYVDSEPEFYVPKVWRKRPPDSIKQGSDESDTITYGIGGTMMFVKETYQNLLNEGVAPEMARMVLPQNMYTEWYWSGTLMAFARVCNLRCKEDTQKETQHIADCIHMWAHRYFRVSWMALREEHME